MEKQEEENLLALLRSTDDEDVILALIIILNNNMVDWLLSKCEDQHDDWYYFPTPSRPSMHSIYWMNRGHFTVGIGHIRLFIIKSKLSNRTMREI